MKQKVVIKVALNGQKSRSKALKIAVGLSGVQSAGLTGKELDQVEVIGQGIDAAVLTFLLRKNVGPADLIMVDSAEKKEEKKEDGEKKIETIPVWNSYPYQFSTAPYYPVHHYPEYINRADSCSIM